ncbi:hypothetical protein TorRG33x02_354970, partial [Trema orientale]
MVMKKLERKSSYFTYIHNTKYNQVLLTSRKDNLYKQTKNQSLKNRDSKPKNRKSK